MVHNLREQEKDEGKKLRTFLIVSGTLVTALNQLSQSLEEKLAIRSLEAENNTWASLRVVRDLVRSGGKRFREKETQWFENAQHDLHC